MKKERLEVYLQSIKTAMQIGRSFTWCCKSLCLHPKDVTDALKQAGRLEELQELLENTAKVFVSDAHLSGKDKKFGEMIAKNTAIGRLKTSLGYWEAACNRQNATPQEVFSAVKKYGWEDAPTACGFDDKEWSDYLVKFPNIAVFK